MFTSPGLLQIVIPFSVGMLLEPLLGELGPEPGALLHADSRVHTMKKKWINFLHWNASNWVTICDSTLKQQWQESLPATSRGRFLTVARGPSFLRSRGLLRRSVTFCFSRERSFRLGSEAEKTNVHTFQSSLNDLVSLQLSPQKISYCNVKTLKCYILK